MNTEIQNILTAIASLKQVIDPEIGLNIIDLGLLYSLELDSTQKQIQCTLTLTTQFCPMGEAIVFGAEQKLFTAFPGYQVNMEVVFDPKWSKEMISETGLQFLNKV